MDRNLEASLVKGRAALTPEWPFLGTSALVFIASVIGTIYWSRTMAGDAMMGSSTQAMAWIRLPGQTWPSAAAAFLGMWLVMMATMMLPSLAYMLLGYRQVLRGSGQTRLGGKTAIAGLGYFCVWALGGAIVYPLGASLAGAETQWMDLGRLAPIATGVTLLLAGGFQLTSWKAHQLENCRDACRSAAPGDLLRPWRYGLRLGMHCLLCSLGFMAVLLVSGVMDLGVMTLLAAAITSERLAPRAKYVTWALGAIAIAAGLVVIALGMGAV